MRLSNRLFKLFKKKREKPLEEPSEKKEEKPSDLKTICGEDSEAYEALHDTMLLNPWLSKTSMEEAAKKGNFRTAGGLAIYTGDIEKVKEYFGKYAECSGRKLKILEIPERAVEKAQRYYAKRLKEKGGK